MGRGGDVMTHYGKYCPHPVLSDEEWMRKKYFDEEKSIADIAMEAGASDTSTWKKIRFHYGWPARRWSWRSKKMDRPHPRGKNHGNWRGGHIDRDTTCADYKDWRRSVLNRDNWECVKCGEKPKKFIAHHILSWRDYPGERYAVDNGLTMCAKCHGSVY